MALIGPEGREQLKLVGRYGSIGLHLVISTAVGFFVGRWLDGVFSTAPTLERVGLGIGILAGFIELYRIVKKTDLSKL